MARDSESLKDSLQTSDCRLHGLNYEGQWKVHMPYLEINAGDNIKAPFLELLIQAQDNPLLGLSRESQSAHVCETNTVFHGVRCTEEVYTKQCILVSISKV